jgi:hypothetical protein
MVTPTSEERKIFQKFSISMSPELYSAMTAASLDRGMNMSRQIETYLRENPNVNRYVSQIRSEPNTGAFIASNGMRRSRHEARR